MSMTNLRRTGALLGSAALLASMTVATVAAPASAGKCEPFTGSFPVDPADCYYATEQIDDSGLRIPDGVTLNGSRADDHVGDVIGTFNGGGGPDYVVFVNGGTFNGGTGDDTVVELVGGLFNGGPGDDTAAIVYGSGVFNGGGGDDVLLTLGLSGGRSGGTYAGGGGQDKLDTYYTGTCYSVELGNGASNC